MPSRVLESRMLMALSAALLLVGLFMIRPYISILALAAILAIIFEPLQTAIRHRLGSPSLSALLTTLVMLSLVLMPIALFGYQLIQEAAGLYGYLTGRAGGNGFGELLSSLQDWTGRIAPGLTFESADIIKYAQSSLTWLLANVGFVFAGFARLLFSSLLLLLVFFYLVRDGHTLKRWLVRISPLSDTHENSIIASLSLAVQTVVRGSLVIALIQGLVAGLGYTIFGVPNAALWAGVLTIASFVPTVGTALVQVPVVAYVFVTGDTGAAIGLTLWAVLAVGLIDNFLGPLLIGRGVRLHPIVTLFAILGGVSLFGPIGLIVGPVTFSVLLAVVRIWSDTAADPSGHAHR